MGDSLGEGGSKHYHRAMNGIQDPFNNCILEVSYEDTYM